MTGRTRPVLLGPLTALSSGGSPVIAGSSPCLVKPIRCLWYSAHPLAIGSSPFGPNGPGASPGPAGVLRREGTGRGEPVVDPGQQLRSQRLGCGRAEHRRAGQVGQFGVGEPVRV